VKGEGREGWEVPEGVLDWLIFAKEFLGVFNEADDDDDGGAGHANEEHDLQNVHGE